MKKSAERKFGMAILLSLLVMVACAAVWGLLFYLGYFAAIVAVLSSGAACYVYYYFNHKLNVGGIMWIILLTILLNAVALVVVEVLSIAGELGLTFTEALGNLNAYMAIPEVAEIMYTNLISSIFFSIIGAVVCVVSFKKEEKKKQQLESNAQAYQEAMNQEGMNNGGQAGGNTTYGGYSNTEYDAEKDIYLK